jgi:hypothetical protein
MNDRIILTPLIAIGGQCNYCHIDLEAMATIYQEAQGKTIYFTCDGCNHDYQITLQEGNEEE